MRIIFFVSLLILLLGFSAKSFSGNLSCRFTAFLIEGDMKSWELLVDSLQKVRLNKADGDVLLYAEYALTGYFFTQDDKKSAARMMEKFENHLDRLMDRYPNTANYHAFKAALYGYKIGLSPWMAPFYSFPHQREVDKAIALRTNEALPLIEQGNSYYFRPSFVGGNKQKAMLSYAAAFAINSKNNPECNWVFFNNGAWLGQVYTKLGYPDKARSVYKQILNVNPNFQYVKDELLPQLDRGEFIDMGSRFEQMLLD
jgi:tetratricopeptide (TPR) repeat protein